MTRGASGCKLVWRHGKNPPVCSFGLLFLPVSAVTTVSIVLLEANRLQPSLAVVYYNLAIAIERRGGGPHAARAAIESYRAALRLDPTDAAGWCNLGAALLRGSGAAPSAGDGAGGGGAGGGGDAAADAADAAKRCAEAIVAFREVRRACVMWRVRIVCGVL